MAGFEALLLYLVVPAAASGLAAFAGWQTYVDLKADPTANFPPGTAGRFVMFPAIVATTAVFGFVLWMLSLPLTAQIDSGSGPVYDVASRVFLWVAIAFAVVAAMTVSSEALVARERMAQFVGADFGRVEPIIVVAQVGSVLAMILGFLVIGRLTSLLENPISVSDTTVDGVVHALQIFALASVAMPAAVGYSNQIQGLRGAGFVRAILRAELGPFVCIAAFAWVYLQLGSL